MSSRASRSMLAISLGPVPTVFTSTIPATDAPPSSSYPGSLYASQSGLPAFRGPACRASHCARIRSSAAGSAERIYEIIAAGAPPFSTNARNHSRRSEVRAMIASAASFRTGCALVGSAGSGRYGRNICSLAIIRSPTL